MEVKIIGSVTLVNSLSGYFVTVGKALHIDNDCISESMLKSFCNPKFHMICTR